LEAFGENNTGQRTELRELALELLSSRPIGLNYEAYLLIISEIYHLLQYHRSGFSDNNNMMHSSMQTQQRQMMPMSQILILHQAMDQLQEYHQQLMYMPQFRAIYGNSTGEIIIPGNTMANNHIQYVSDSYQSVRPQIIASLQVIAYFKFKKLPFYYVIDGIIKLTVRWAADRRIEQSTSVTEMTMFRWTSGVTGEDRIKNEYVDSGQGWLTPKNWKEGEAEEKDLFFLE